MQKIKTAGNLRDFLCEALELIEAGDMSPETARSIVKVSAQINESIYAELKHKKIQLEMGQQTEELGSLRLGA